MTKKVGVEMRGTWLRVSVMEAGPDDGRIGPVMKHPTPTAWDDLIGLLAPFDDADTEGFGIAISGPIADHATVVKAPNIPWLEGWNVRRDLETV